MFTPTQVPYADQIPPGISELMRLERSKWDAISAEIPHWHPRNEGDEEEDESGSGDESGSSGTEGKGSGSSGSSGDEEDEEEEDEEEKPKGKKKKSKEEEEESGDDDYERLPRSEVQRLKRIAADADKEKKKVEDQKKAEERRKKADEGRWQEILDEEKENTTKAIQERDEAISELTQFKREILVTKVANRLAFRDPSDAHLYLQADDMDDEKVTERMLQKVLREKPYLKSDRRPTGGPGSGNGDAGLSMEDVAKMSQEEVNKRWPEISKIMASSRGR